MKIALTFLLLFSLSNYAELSSHYYKTDHKIPTFRVSKKLSIPFKLFRYSLPKLSEATTLLATLNLAPNTTKVSPEKTAILNKSFTKIYQEIARDPDFKTIKSSLVYSYSPKITQGHYYLYKPKKITRSTPSIIFLHGFGGNFLFYLKIMKEQFPDHIILFPTHSYSWLRGGSRYLHETIEHLESTQKIQLNKPCLFALSAGGPAGLRIYNEEPFYFKGLIMITSFFHKLKAKDFETSLKILVLNGTKDERLPIKRVRIKRDKFQRRIPGLKFKELPYDHFLMLTQSKDCFSPIKKYMKTFNK